jgi:hypothetical protein
LTEPDFRKIIASLWAFVGWTNKDYVADRVLTYKDVKELRSELKELLYGKPHSRSAMTFQALIGILQSGVQRSLGRASGRVSSPYRFFNLFSARGILPPRHRFQTLIGILQSRKRSCTVWRCADVSSPYRYSSNDFLSLTITKEKRVSSPYRYSSNPDQIRYFPVVRSDYAGLFCPSSILSITR